jgi:transposase-like protein
MANRKQLTPEQKVSIIRRHLVEGVPVSDLCEEFGIHPPQYYNWQKQFFEQGAVAFQRKTNKSNERRRQAAQDRKIEELEGKIQKKNEVVAELLEEHVQLKKELGEL